MYKKGTKKKELMTLLKDMSELTGLDRVVHTGQKLHIDAEISGRGRDLLWAIDADSNGYSSANILSNKGKGYPALMKCLKRLDEEAVADEKIVVLALAQASEAKNFDGTISTIWYCVDPCAAGMEDADAVIDSTEGVAHIEYPIVSLQLTEAEYKPCVASKLAFYDEFREILYPIQECAYQSVGSLLDCACVFKYKSNAPIMAATFLADRLAGTKDIRFLYRKRTENVHPLISIVGKNYAMFPQQKFVSDALTIVNKNAISTIGYWSVTDELTRVNIEISGYNALWHPEIELQVSDTVGKSMAVTAYIRMGHGKILLKRNTAYHWESFTNKGGVKTLFEGIFESITSFANAYEQCYTEVIYFKQDMISHYEKIIGKKRFMRTDIPADGYYNFHQVLFAIVNNTYYELNPRWALELSRENYTFFSNLCSRCNDRIESVESNAESVAV